MAEKEGVIVAGSPPETEIEPDENQSPAGKQALEGRSIENLLAENKRKAGEIQSLKSDIESMRDELSELKELSEKRSLTSSERNRREDLEDEIKETVKRYRQHKDAQAWIRIAIEESERISLDHTSKSEIMRANDFIEDKAAELGMDADELAKAILPFKNNKEGQSLYRRMANAFIDWRKSENHQKELKEKEDKLKTQEEEIQRFRETGTRQPRDPSLEQKWEKADSKEKERLYVDLLEQSSSQK